MRGFARSFDEPDEVITTDLVESSHIELGGVVFSRDVHHPGWRWSEHVKPVVGTEWCETHHVGYVLEGSARVLTRDGVEYETGQGDVYDIPPGHDSWVVGDAPFVCLVWRGARSWLTPMATLKERILATVVFTDLVDSTAIARDLGDQVWTDLLSAHHQRIADTVDHYQGRLVQRTGDGVLAIFDGAARAIRCAIACSRTMKELDLSIRAAVHTGEIELADAEIHGIAVHEASRILDIAAADEVLVSARTVDLADDNGLRFDDRGQHELRGSGVSRNLFAAATLEDTTA